MNQPYFCLFFDDCSHPINVLRFRGTLTAEINGYCNSPLMTVSWDGGEMSVTASPFHLNTFPS